LSRAVRKTMGNQVRLMAVAKQTQRWKEYLSGYLFITPNFIGFLVFLLGPIIAVIYFSFTNYNLSTAQWIGPENYLSMFRNTGYWNSLVKTLIFVGVNVPLQSGVALLVAVAVNQKIRYPGIFRTIFVIPWVCLPVSIGMTFSWLMQTDFGMINQLLRSLHLPGVPWLTSPKLALYSLILVNAWEYLGFHIVIYLAGLQSVPTYLYEAAMIDGATSRVRFLRITLPLLMPVIFFDIIMNTIGTFQIFDIVFVMTQGGPGAATSVYNFELYKQAFTFFRMGYACSMAVILLLIIIGVILLQFWFFRKRGSYEVG